MGKELIRKLLKEAFMEKNRISQYQLAMDIGVTERTVAKILKGEQRVTVGIGLRLAKYFGTEELFFIEKQLAEDVQEAKKKHGGMLDKIQAVKVRKHLQA